MESNVTGRPIINKPIKPGQHVLRDRNDENRTAFCTECNTVVKTWKKGTRFRCSQRQEFKRNAFRENNPGYDRNYWYMKTYGITLEDYSKLLEEQDGVCKICKEPEKEEWRNLAVDHDHSCCPGRTSCGKCIRGLLCWGCNTTLGRLEPNFESFSRYLERK